MTDEALVNVEDNKPRVGRKTEKGLHAPQWEAMEFIKLRKLYPSAPWAEILDALPLRTRSGIALQAFRRRIRRNRIPMKLTGFYLIDEIRLRARKLNIPILELGSASGAKHFFSTNRNTVERTVNLFHICKAIEILGGELKIILDEDR